jgi:hypothetical protein
LANDAVVSMSKVWTWDSTDLAATFRFSIDQSVDGVAAGSFSSTKTTTYAAGDGTFYIHVQSSDPFGNQSSVSTASFIMDHTGASISGLSNDIVPAATKTWTWSSADVGATFRYIVDQDVSGVPVGEYGATLTASQLTGDGTYYLHVQSKDLTGVEGAVTTVSAILDNSAPVITGITNDETVTNSKVWSFASTDLSSVTYRFAIDQDVGGLPSGEYVVQSSTTHSTGNGTFYIHLQAQDSLGHASAVSTASFVMDTTVPASVTVSGLSDSTSTSVDATISGNEITHYQYKIDGGEFSAERLISQHIILSGLSVATHTFTVRGRDAAGNYQTSNTTASWTVAAPVVVTPSSSGGGGGGGGGSGGAGSSSSSKPKKDPVRKIMTKTTVTPVVVSPVVASVTPFVDTANHWSKPYVEKLHELGVVKGKGTGSTFAPDDNLSRAELTKIALLTFGYKDFNEEYSGFKDVRTDLWYYPYVVKAFMSGIIKGYGDATFHPDSPVSRVEILKIVLLSAKININPDANAKNWYDPYVSFALKAGILSSNDRVLTVPNEFITRAEMAAVAVKTLDYVTALKN